MVKPQGGFASPTIIPAGTEPNATPLGLNRYIDPFPRVAAKARQPWALGRNRFAVQ